MTSQSVEYDNAFYRSYYETIHPAAKRVSFHGMFDCHAFHRFNCSSVNDLIEQWREMSGPIIEKYGHPMLCPAIVLDSQGKELRRVGDMIYITDTDDKVQEYRAALLQDPDIPRIIKES